jgi:hypothetical protein
MSKGLDTAPRLDGGLDAVVRVGDDKLDPLNPRRRSLRRNSVQRVSASEALGAAMRRVVNEVEDAEFRDVDTGEVSGGPPT